jgi:hypothetical protein
MSFKTFAQKVRLVLEEGFEDLLPFLEKVLTDEFKALKPIVEKTVDSIAALPNYNSMTFLECLGVAVPQIIAEALVVLKKEVSVGVVIDQIQIALAKKQALAKQRLTPPTITPPTGTVSI